MGQDADQNQRLAQLEADVALLARRVGNMSRVPGHHGRWDKNDWAAFNALLDRIDPMPEPERGTEPVVDPTDWEAREQPHDDLSGPARMA